MALEEEVDIAVENAVVHQEKHHHKHKHKHSYEGKHMSEPVNIFTTTPYAAAPYAGGYGGACGGFGGGIGEGLVLGLLAGRGGFGGWGGGYGGYGGGFGGGAGALEVQASVDTVAILQGIGDLKASVPLSEAQLQLAIAQSQDAVTTQTLEQTIALSAGQTAIQLAQANTLFQLSTITHDEGEKTRALITNNQIAELNRIAAERWDEIVELRSERRRDNDRHGLEINMINNQNQNQMQFQAQAQLLNQFGHLLHSCDQSIRATNQAVNIGSGTQTANPNNNNTNNKVN